MMKRLFAAMLAAMMLLPCLAACGEDTPDVEMQRVDHVYRGEFFTTTDEIELNSQDYFLSSDVMTFRASRVLERNAEGYAIKTEPILYHISMTDYATSVTEIPRKLIRDEEKGLYAAVSAVAYNAEQMAVMEYVYQNDKQTNILTVYDNTGKELYSVDPAPLVQMRDDPMAEMRGRQAREWEFYCNNLRFGAGGVLYMVTEYSIVALDAQGQRMYEAAATGYIDSTVLTADGRLLVKYYDMAGRGGNVTVFMDDGKRGFSDPITLPEVDMRNAEIYLGPGYEYYIKADDGLYGLNTGDAAPILLCNWINSDINPSSIRDIVVVDADSIVYMGTDPVTYTFEAGILHRVPDEEVQPRYIITLGGINFSQDLQSAVVKFNRGSEEYRIVTRNFWTENQASAAPSEDMNQVLKDAILAEDAPDMIYVSGGFDQNLVNLERKGVFTDLYPLMDKDENFDKENLLPCILAPFEQDGKLYQMNVGVQIGGLYGKAENLKAYENWTMETFFKLKEDAEKAGKTGLSYEIRERMEELLLYRNLQSFADLDTAKCEFDSDTFRQLLEYLASLPTYEEYNNQDNPERTERITSVRKGETLLNSESGSSSALGSFTDYIKSKATLGNDPLTVLGVPTAEGGAITLQGQGVYAILETSPLKKGAWEFIAYLFSDEIMVKDDMRHDFVFPTTKTAIEAMAENSKKMYYVFDLDGSGWSGSGWDGVTIPDRKYDENTEIPGYLTDEDIAAVMEMLTNARWVTSGNGADETLRAIIAEELGALYAGNATVEDTAKIIQSRASLYLSEQS